MSEQTKVVEMSEEEKKAQTEFYRAMSEQTLKHLGGVRKLIAMINARYFVFDKSALTFTFSGCPKANRCKITLDEGKDLYELHIFKSVIRNDELKITDLYKQANLYDDMLKSEFEKATGLRLSL